jgi:hypothetical protein
MRYRKLGFRAGDVGGDMVFGRGIKTHWIDNPDAVGQAVLTRLKLELGEWFLDLDEGMPWKTRVLGKYTGDIRDPVIRFRILETPGVQDIMSYSSNLNRETRAFFVEVLINSVYGVFPIETPL